MNRLTTLFALLLVAVVWAGCDSFVEDIGTPINNISDEQLNDPSQIPFLINGVLTRFASTYDQAALLSDGLSDAFFFDQRVPNATFPTYQQIDIGQIDLDNNSVDAFYNDIGELRLFADTLLTRMDRIEGGDQALRDQALYTGNFFGGVARYFYAAYIGLNPTEGGGVINAGPFIPANQMYAQALERLNKALQFVDAGSYEARVTNSTIARIHLYQGDFGQARTFAAKGMKEGDEPFASKYSTTASNLWYVQAGVGRTQWVADFRFKQYVDDNPQEAARVKIEAIQGNDNPPTTFYRQARYPERETPLPFMTWQENELMLAELDLRDGNAAGALARVNNVRASHGIDPLASVDMDALIVERDKELFTQGARVIDERRFARWHLGSGTWQYLPITERERNANPNLN